MRGLGPLFRAIVASASACGTDGTSGPDAQADASFDATTADATLDAPADASISDVPAEDAPALDSYVDWCEAGPPELVWDGGCYGFYYVPCGLPAGDSVNDAGAISRCDQICPASDDCAALTPALVAVLVDAGLVDAATAATADDGGAVFTLCACLSTGGRRPQGLRKPHVRARSALGAYFSRMAHLERASIRAFERMETELRALGAPRSIIEATRVAKRDEVRHARMMDRLASRFGGVRVSPRYWVVTRHRSVQKIARENTVEGCVRETYGAVVATWQASHARNREVRDVMARVAADETRHAELSWDVARFLDSRLDAVSIARNDREMHRAVSDLRAEASIDANRTMVAIAGTPPARVASALLDALAATLWA